MKESMAFITDEGSVFTTPMEKIWKLNASEEQHNHPSLKNIKVGPVAENS